VRSLRPPPRRPLPPAPLRRLPPRRPLLRALLLRPPPPMLPLHVLLLRRPLRMPARLGPLLSLLVLALKRLRLQLMLLWRKQKSNWLKQKLT